MNLRFLSLLCVVGSALAAEPVKLPLELGTLKTRDGRVFDRAKVVAQDAVGIKILHEAGSARIAHDRLPEDVASRFTFDRSAAKAQLEKEAAEGAAHERAMQLAETARNAKPLGQGDGGAAADPGDALLSPEIPVEKMQVLDGKAVADRLVTMKSYLRRLEISVEEMNKDIIRRGERADRMQKKAVYDKGVEHVRKMAGKQMEKVDEANQLIRQTQREIQALEKTLINHPPPALNDGGQIGDPSFSDVPP